MQLYRIADEQFQEQYDRYWEFGGLGRRNTRIIEELLRTRQYIRYFDLCMDCKNSHDSNLDGAASCIPEGGGDAIEITLGHGPNNSSSRTWLMEEKKDVG